MSTRTTPKENKMKRKASFALVVAAGALSFGLLAEAQPGNAGDRGRHGPPPEAIEACAGATAGDACSVETPHGTLAGTCRQVPNLEELACVPHDHRGGPPRNHD